MKYNHNKKRNTAFIYETLILEISRAIMKEDLHRKALVMGILKEFFKKNKPLKRDLEIYRAFDDLAGVTETTINKIIVEAKKQFSDLDRKTVFDTQTRLISEVNKKIGPSVWTNYVPKYKKLATINQVLVQNQAPKQQVLLEQKLVDGLLSKKLEEAKISPPVIDNLAVKNFISKFNNQYSETLNEDQKTFLYKYMTASDDNELDFKLFLYEEVDRLKEVITNTANTADKQTSVKLSKVLARMSDYSRRKIDKDFITEIIKIQSLAKEVSN